MNRACRISYPERTRNHKNQDSPESSCNLSRYRRYLRDPERWVTGAPSTAMFSSQRCSLIHKPVSFQSTRLTCVSQDDMRDSPIVRYSGISIGLQYDSVHDILSSFLLFPSMGSGPFRPLPAFRLRSCISMCASFFPCTSNSSAANSSCSISRSFRPMRKSSGPAKYT